MAALAEASYVFFDKLKGVFSTEAVEKALNENNSSDFGGRFTATQAADFVTHWQVISHQENTDSGFSATLFKSIDNPGECENKGVSP